MTSSQDAFRKGPKGSYFNLTSHRNHIAADADLLVLNIKLKNKINIFFQISLSNPVTNSL